MGWDGFLQSVRASATQVNDWRVTQERNLQAEIGSLSVSAGSAIEQAKRLAQKTKLQADILLMEQHINSTQRRWGSEAWDAMSAGDLASVSQIFERIKPEVEKLRTEIAEKRAEIQALEAGVAPHRGATLPFSIGSPPDASNLAHADLAHEPSPVEEVASALPFAAELEATPPVTGIPIAAAVSAAAAPLPAAPISVDTTSHDVLVASNPAENPDPYAAGIASPPGRNRNTSGTVSSNIDGSSAPEILQGWAEE